MNILKYFSFLLILGGILICATNAMAQNQNDPVKSFALAGKWRGFYDSLDHFDLTESGGKSFYIITRYEFSAVGAVQMTFEAEISANGCRTQISQQAQGQGILNDSKLIINWLPAQIIKKDLCAAANDYQKTLPAVKEVFQVSFEKRGDQKLLCLKSIEKQGKACYFPDKN